VRRSFVLLIIIAIGFGVYQYLKKDTGHTAIEEIERVRGPIAELLEEREVRGGEVVFYLSQSRAGEQVVSADFVQKSFLGWKWSNGGGHSLPADSSWSYQYMPALKGSILGDSPFPLVFGTFGNPEIVSVTMKNVKTGEVHKAQVIPSQGKVKLWYAFIQEEQGSSFDITGLSSTGEIVSEKQFIEKKKVT
jgi:hypothetical protein